MKKGQNRKFGIVIIPVCIILIIIGVFIRLLLILFSPNISNTEEFNSSDDTSVYIQTVHGSDLDYKIIKTNGEVVEEGVGGALEAGGPGWSNNIATNFSSKGNFLFLHRGNESTRTGLPKEIDIKEVSVYSPVDESKVLIGFGERFGDPDVFETETKYIYVYDTEGQKLSDDLYGKIIKLLPTEVTNYRLLSVSSSADVAKVEETGRYEVYDFDFYFNKLMYKVRYDVLKNEGEYKGTTTDTFYIYLVEGGNIECCGTYRFNNYYVGITKEKHIFRNFSNGFVNLYLYPIYSFFDQNLNEISSIGVGISSIKPQESNEDFRLELKESIVGVNKLQLRNTKDNTIKTLISWFGYKRQYPIEWMQLSSGDFIVIINDEIGIVDSKNTKLIKLTEFPNYYSPGSYKVTVL